jgi:hypothetical protein
MAQMARVEMQHLFDLARGNALTGRQGSLSTETPRQRHVTR